MAMTVNSPWCGFGFLGSSEDFPSWAVVAEPPEGNDPDYEVGADEALDSLVMDRWLFVPNATPSAPSLGADAAADARHPSSRAGAPAAPGSRSEHQDAWEDPAHVEDMMTSFPFSKLQSIEARKLIVILLAPAWKRVPGSDAYSAACGRSLAEFAKQACSKLQVLTDQGTWLIPSLERDLIVNEAMHAMGYLVQQGWVDISRDLLLCLEAFEIGRHKTDSVSTWMSECISMVITAALDKASPSDQSTWREHMKRRIQSDDDLYGEVDVRAWPHILKMVGVEANMLDRDACGRQIRHQLCMHSDLTEWTHGLKQASKLVNELQVWAREDDEGNETGLTFEDVYDIFNDSGHFHRSVRREFLINALTDAPRGFVQQVLGYIDANDADLGERIDEEIQLVMELITGLNGDVRWCNNAFFQMRSEWLVGKFHRQGHDGVVSNQELSPEQICDHIEDEPNHEDLLKIAVKEYLWAKPERKFEAARMLARRKSEDTPVFQTERKDNQMAYLVSLYSGLHETEDQFGPIEEDCLVLPHARKDVLYVGEGVKEMEKLELELGLMKDTVSYEQPMAVGMWWLWRCFNNVLDKMVRATFIALAFGDTLVIVDLQKLEQQQEAVEKKGKDLLCRILAAPHLLKVAHDVDGASLLILQRGLQLCKDIDGEKHLVFSGVSPILDISVAAAFVKQMQPRAPAVAKLLKLTDDYLRMQICMAEALSNFERRPLRLSQQHYALTLAWCPLMILRVLTTHDILKVKDLLDMTFQLGCEGAPLDWDEVLHNLWMCSPEVRATPEACAALDFMSVLPAPHCPNPWDISDWVQEVPRPEASFSVRSALPAHLDAIRLPAGQQHHAMQALLTLGNKTVADLERLYKAQAAHRQARQTETESTQGN